MRVIRIRCACFPGDARKALRVGGAVGVFQVGRVRGNPFAGEGPARLADAVLANKRFAGEALGGDSQCCVCKDGIVAN